MSSCINYETRTDGQIEIHTLIWTMQKFNENESIREFRTEKSKDPADSTESRFQLKIKLLGRNNELIEIYYLSPKPVNLKSILTKSYELYKEHSRVIDEYQTIQANKWQYLFHPQFKTYHDRMQTTLRYDRLELTFQFMVFNDIKVDRSNFSEAQLSNDFENILNDGLFSDVTMKSAEVTEYKVHKVVLASRSAVLKAHFEHNTTECYTNVVETPLESEVLREVLTFIYSDKAPRVDEIPEKLLAAADYYQLSGLKSLCEEALHKKLTVENAIETLDLAALHSAKALTQFTLDFIKDGRAKLITKTQGWAQEQSVEVIKSICEYLTADEIDADIILLR